MKIACIGARDLLTEESNICTSLGELIVGLGYELHSGNAPGADQAFALGGNNVNPDLVNLHLPWRSFESPAILPRNVLHILDDLPKELLTSYYSIAEQNHPVWDKLTAGVRKLMARNSSILLPNGAPVNLCLAFPSTRRGGGGTGQGMRIAHSLGIHCVDLRKTQARQELDFLRERLQQMGWEQVW